MQSDPVSSRSQMACVPPILVLNYKLPAHPEQVKEELEATLRWLRAQGYTEVVIAGDSAGGYLAVQTYLEQSSSQICGAVGICPPLDLSFTADSHHRNAKSCFLTERFMRYARDSYLQIESKDGPIAEATARMYSLQPSSDPKLVAKLKERPLMLVACEQDPLYDDNAAFAQQAAKVGAAEGVLLCDVRGEATFHISLLMPGMENEPHRRAMNQIASYIGKALR
ncbi:unnamed protein product [Durusdinium trenchii]|uniref:Alpha/beta hydrolase fold-3 domain-containing protein n=1 Tax=Durusdinium trenchii TaxID=1381693 RepID=A0ABP0J698_9DINO